MTVTRVIQAREGSHLTDGKAAEIDKYIHKRFGRHFDAEIPVTAEEVEKDAQNPKTPYHSEFEWDDARAAHEHRLNQARRLLGSIMVVVMNGDEEVRTRGYHHVVSITEAGDRISGYLPDEKVWVVPDYATQVIEYAKRQLEVWIEQNRDNPTLLAWAREELKSV